MNGIYLVRWGGIPAEYGAAVPPSRLPKVPLPSSTLALAIPGALLGVTAWMSFAQTGPVMTAQRMANNETLLQAPGTPGGFQRIEVSTDLQAWQGLVTGQTPAGGTFSYTDGGSPYRGRRFYRPVPLTGTGIVTGEHLATADGEVVIHPVNHGSFVLQWNGKMIYSDPVGAATVYAGLPKADLILVTHSHGDHFSNTTMEAVRNGAAARIVAPQAVYNSMTTTLKGLTTILKTGQTNPADNTAAQTIMGLTIEGVPAYNANHPLGTANAYVLTIGGKRLFISGDTGNTPEMRALQNIDAAFVCMNVPFTMTVADAVAAVRAFKPKVVYPYHLRNQDGSYSDVNSFKQQVGTDLGIEVRPRTWY